VIDKLEILRRVNGGLSDGRMREKPCKTKKEESIWSYHISNSHLRLKTLERKGQHAKPKVKNRKKAQPTP